MKDEFSANATKQSLMHPDFCERVKDKPCKGRGRVTLGSI